MHFDLYGGYVFPFYKQLNHFNLILSVLEDNLVPGLTWFSGSSEAMNLIKGKDTDDNSNLKFRAATNSLSLFMTEIRLSSRHV